MFDGSAQLYYENSSSFRLLPQYEANIKLYAVGKMVITVLSESLHASSQHNKT